MTIEEMKRIAAARSPGLWYATDADYCGRDLSGSSSKSFGYTVSQNPEESGWETDSGFYVYTISKENAEFFAMAANNFEKLLVVVEAMLRNEELCDSGQFHEMFAAKNRLIAAVKALEEI